MALFVHRGMHIVLDIRNLPDPRSSGGSGGAVYRDMWGGNYIYCEQGVIRVARGGGAAYDHDGQQIKKYQGNGGSGHELNFVHAIRAGDRSQLNAEIEVGHLSTAMCHQANIAFRVGRRTNVEEVRDGFGDHEDVRQTLEAMVAQIEGNGIDLSEQKS